MPMRVLRPRLLITVTYLMYVIAGVVFLIVPSKVVAASAPPFWVAVWHAFLIVGGAICIGGSWTKRPGVEAAGVPLIISSVLAYGVMLSSAAASPQPGVSLGSVGLSFLMFGSMFGLAGRMVEMVRLMRISTDIHRRARE